MSNMKDKLMALCEKASAGDTSVMSEIDKIEKTLDTIEKTIDSLDKALGTIEKTAATLEVPLTVLDTALKVAKLIPVPVPPPVPVLIALLSELIAQIKQIVSAMKAVAEKMGMEAKNHCTAIEGLPVRPPVMCAGCPHRGLFYTLNKNRCTVMGDIGCYTLGAVAPLSAIDVTACMGASISSIHGFNKARGTESEKKTVAVIGDSTFMHSGMTGLANVAYNQSNSTVVILDNSITGMTGHQQNPTTGYNIKGDPAGKINLENLCKSMGFERVRVVDPYNLEETDQAVKEELAADAPSVIISRRPCALLKYVKHKPPLKVNRDKCRSCKACMRLGCPALSFKDGKAHVDTTLCVGCDVCNGLCKFDAFEHPEGGANA